MSIKDQVTKIDNLVSKGAIVDAVKTFFSESANTSDYNNLTTVNKNEMLNKMEGFTNSISKVNEIKLHSTIVDGFSSASEFTFDFDMKDGSKIFWHEIIKRHWDENGKVINEKYFLAN